MNLYNEVKKGIFLNVGAVVALHLRLFLVKRLEKLLSHFVLAVDSSRKDGQRSRLSGRSSQQ